MLSAERVRTSVVARMEQIISEVNFDLNWSDSVQWKEGLDEKFSVKSCHNILNSMYILCGPLGEFDIVLSRVWKMEVPKKIKAFRWRCFIDRLPTRGALSHRGILPYSNTSCVFCWLCEETGGHLLLLCHNVYLV